MSKTLQNGSFQDAVGTVVNGGTIEFVLSHDAMIIAGGQVAPTRVTATLDSSGDMPSAFTILANDELTPSGTFYLTTVFDSNGARVFGPERWVFSGASPIDLDTMTPTIVDPAFADPILSNPTATQAIADFNLSVPILNNIRVVDGGKYALTDVGIQAAIDDAGDKGYVKLSPVVHTLAATVTIAHDDFTLDMTGATLNCEVTGVGIRFGATGVRHLRNTAIGGLIRKTSSGTFTPDFTAGVTGVEWLNQNNSNWTESYQIFGFNTGVSFRSEDGQGTIDHSSYFKQIVHCKFGVFVEPTAAADTDAFMQNINFYGGLIVNTNDTDNTGGYSVWIDPGSVPTATAASHTVSFFGTEMRNSATATNRPEAALWLNGSFNQFYGVRMEGFTKNAWTIDNSGAKSEDNLFVFPLSTALGFDSTFRDTTTNVSQHIFSVTQTWLSGGGSARPLLVLRETDADTNKVFSVRDTSGTENLHMLSNGSFVGKTSPLEGTLSNTPRWIFKQVDFGDMTAGATADTFTLWTLPANTMIHDIVGTVVTAWSGGSISAAVASVGTNGGAANDLALDDDFGAAATVYELHDATASGGKGALLYDATDKFAPYMAVAAATVELQMDLTGDNHVNATAGQARIYALVSQPLGNTTVEAN